MMTVGRCCNRKKVEGRRLRVDAKRDVRPLVRLSRFPAGPVEGKWKRWLELVARIVRIGREKRIDNQVRYIRIDEGRVSRNANDCRRARFLRSLTKPVKYVLL